ncbi:type I 3-dehydroquinate dehydratase [Stygiolobus caldivivus]|uniref:3-dehydroquinate dehydratase n=1 Tax=Stygiolobus caldivivus TaxID=2824673 RepID=A0A8D5U4S5_9CREN|nr:type I 3-dehydroquinate dehydratase [Stygiolobus caldivivus]BCU69460.1 3-dehydroquinase [Stygiolobus caldivivus]
MTCVVVALPVRTISGVQMRIKSLVDADYVELRLDYMNSLPQVEELAESIKEFKRKTIVTIRDINEGGVNYIKEEEKANFYKILYDYGLIYDVEVRFLKKFRVPYEDMIVSLHYFNSLPTYDEVREAFTPFSSKSLVKLAVVGTGKYKQLLTRVLEDFPNSAVMPMKVNPIERIAFSILGSKLLYAHSGEETAQGQMYYKDAKNILSYFDINCEKVIGSRQ